MNCFLASKCILLFWQDGVKAAKRSIQMEIQTAVHKIYQQLSVTLERALQANKHHIGNDLLIKSLSWQFMRSRDLFSLVLSKWFTSLTRVKIRATFRTG